MGIVQKQGISVAFVSFLGVIIGALNTMFVFPNVLGAERHGLVMLILSIATVIAQFAHLGLPNTIIRFFPYLKDHKKYIYRLAFQIPIISVLLLVICAFLFGDFILQGYSNKNELFDQHQILLLPLVASLVFFEVLLSISRSELKTIFPAVLREFVLRLMTLMFLGAYFMSWINFDQFILYWLALYGLNVFLLCVYLLSSNYLKLQFGFPLFPDNSLAKKMLHYSGITLLTSSAAIFVNSIDVLMLGHYLKIENVAFYTVAFFMASLIEIPARSILQIVKPLLAKAWSEGDVNEIATLYRKTSINQMIIGLLLFIGIWMSIDDVLTFVPEKYQGIQNVFFYVGLAKLINVSAGVNGTIILTSDKYRFDLYINLFLILVTVTTNVFFIPKYGIEGAAMATALALFIHNMVKTLILYSFYKIQPFQMATFKLVAIGISTFLLVLIIPVDVIEITWLRILLRSFLITALFTFAVIVLSISEDVNVFYKKCVRYFK
mgnify:FL=1|tara:strand:+ start:489 stop:1964 length:1476 start_codon:yes stop_codon:yes gene_type:complete